MASAKPNSSICAFKTSLSMEWQSLGNTGSDISTFALCQYG